MVSLDEYMAAPMIASPHCLFDCDMPVCGAAAFVMTTARHFPEGCQPVYVRGWSGHQKPHAVFEMSGLSPDDIDHCQLYDGFSRSEEHTSELQSLMRISYAVFCLKKKKTTYTTLRIMILV